jgi:hypothetical protein
MTGLLWTPQDDWTAAHRRPQLTYPPYQEDPTNVVLKCLFKLAHAF